MCIIDCLMSTYACIISLSNKEKTRKAGPLEIELRSAKHLWMKNIQTQLNKLSRIALFCVPVIHVLETGKKDTLYH